MSLRREKEKHPPSLPCVHQEQGTDSPWSAQGFLGSNTEVLRPRKSLRPGKLSLLPPRPAPFAHRLPERGSPESPDSHHGSQSKSPQPGRVTQTRSLLSPSLRVSGKVPVFLETPKVNGVHGCHYGNCRPAETRLSQASGPCSLCNYQKAFYMVPVQTRPGPAESGGSLGLEMRGRRGRAWKDLLTAKGRAAGLFSPSLPQQDGESTGPLGPTVRPSSPPMSRACG